MGFQSRIKGAHSREFVYTYVADVRMYVVEHASYSRQLVQLSPLFSKQNT